MSLQREILRITLTPLSRIFELGASQKPNNAGFGLVIAKMLIEKRFGGKIDVHNRDGGAEFILTLQK